MGADDAKLSCVYVRGCVKHIAPWWPEVNQVNASKRFHDFRLQETHISKTKVVIFVVNLLQAELNSMWVNLQKLVLLRLRNKRKNKSKRFNLIWASALVISYFNHFVDFCLWKLAWSDPPVVYLLLPPLPPFISFFPASPSEKLLVVLSGQLCSSRIDQLLFEEGSQPGAPHNPRLELLIWNVCLIDSGAAETSDLWAPHNQSQLMSAGELLHVYYCGWFQPVKRLH